MADSPEIETSRRDRIHEIIFGAETPAGKAFDLTLLIVILLSILAVTLESVAGIRAQYGEFLRALEWAITILFTIEYILRLYSVRKPWKYTLSFYGIVDLLSILPTYLSIFFTGTQSLLVIRALRLLRVFRILKLAHFVGEARMLRAALRASVRKITVFLGAVLTIVIIVGAVMYMIEGGDNGFTSIPQSIYWAIVTMTTVGYGDVAPQTLLGKIVASAVMILGYAIIAVPTGIVSAEMAKAMRRQPVSTQACPERAADGHDWDAKFCKYCSGKL